MSPKQLELFNSIQYSHEMYKMKEMGINGPSPTEVVPSTCSNVIFNFLHPVLLLSLSQCLFKVVQWSLCPFVMCASITAGLCLSKTVDLLRLYALLPRCDSVLANNVQRGPPLCQPRPLSHQAHLRFLLHTSRKAQILLRLDTR